MKEKRRHRNSNEPSLTTELLIMPDGQVLVHNLTSAFADLLRELNPQDEQLSPRARLKEQPTHVQH